MSTRFRTVLLTAAALALLGASPALAKVLAKVNGGEITDDDVRIAEQDLGASLPQQLQGAARQTYVLDYLIDLKLAAAQGAKDGAAETADFARQMAYYRDKTLMEGVLGALAKTAATPEAEQKVYDDAAKAQKPEEEIHARHILVPTEDEAKAALARVKGGEDFAKVADEVSKDPGIRRAATSMVHQRQMVPAFADAAFKLQPGDVSSPVKSEFGWHVIKVEGKRREGLPALRYCQGPDFPLRGPEGTERRDHEAARGSQDRAHGAAGTARARPRRRGCAGCPDAPAPDAPRAKTLRLAPWPPPSRSRRSPPSLCPTRRPWPA